MIYITEEQVNKTTEALKLQMFKANKRNELVRRTKLIIETDRLSRYVGYNMQAPLVGGSGLWGASCYYCKASIGARLICHVCGTSNALVKPAWTCGEPT